MVQGLAARDGLVQLALAVPSERAREMEPLRRAAETLRPAAGRAQRHRGADRAPGPQGPKPGGAGTRRAACAWRPRTRSQGPGRARRELLPEVRHIIAVASGKGGVGKSTTAVNLAVALAPQGLRVGLLDADIYGPSLPRMLGTRESPAREGQQMIPLARWGLKAMSIGFLVEEETPMIWRGPMVMGALEQMMGQVAWGELDIMVVDMPPGTGDAQLTMAQRVPLAGAVIVSTPQDVALLDARRGVRMFEKATCRCSG